MINQLEAIIVQKKREVSDLEMLVRKQPEHPIAKILYGKMKRDSEKSFKKSLCSSSLAVIAEIKRKSPSKGSLASIDDPVSLAKNYIEGGANALSILTDKLFFGGNLDDLSQVAMSLDKYLCPILRKDFIVHEIQIAQAIAAGADAILCIVAILGKKTKFIIESAKAMGIEVLVEVHNRQELDIALESSAEIIGINNRNLSTFQIDTQLAFKLFEYIPKHVVKIAESGILEPKLAQEYYRFGFDGVLIGEALVKSAVPSEFIRACRYV